MTTALCGTPPQDYPALFPSLPAYRARQICAHVLTGAASFAEALSLPKPLRESLDSSYTLRTLEVTGTFGTKDALKLRLAPKGGGRFSSNSGGGGGINSEVELYSEAVEAVLLTDGKGRRTACLSTQAGCAVGCVFCRTGQLGLVRSLTSSEIVEQFFQLRDAASKAERGAVIDNIVFMGMGEPLHNLTELRKSVSVFQDGLGLSWRRLTVSTSGAAGGIKSLTEHGPRCRLAFSLVTGIAEKRAHLVPRSSPLAEIQRELRLWQEKYSSRLTLEIPLLGGVNTSREDAASVAAFASGLLSKNAARAASGGAHRCSAASVVVNLIPWNAVSGLCFEGRPLSAPSREEIRSFTAMLEGHGLKTVLRRGKGDAVSAACGQLGGISVPQFRSASFQVPPAEPPAFEA